MQRRESLIIIAALVLVSGVAWVFTVRHMGHMGHMGLGMMTHGMTMGLPFSLSNAGLYVVLWGVMMIAMMFPSIAPMAVLFSTISRRKREEAAPYAPAWIFAAGYSSAVDTDWRRCLCGRSGYSVTASDIPDSPDLWHAHRRRCACDFRSVSAHAIKIFVSHPVSLAIRLFGSALARGTAGRFPNGLPPRRVLFRLLLEPDGRHVCDGHDELGLDGHSGARHIC